jgi:hypothetical protein
MNPLVRTETLSYGIVGQSLEQVTRHVPSDEPPPLPPTPS